MDRSVIRKILWLGAGKVVFRMCPGPAFGVRRLVLVLFGAKLAPDAKVYRTCSVYAPWLLTMDSGATLGPYVDCYNCARVSIGKNTTISQRSFLCTGTHDINTRLIFKEPRMELISKPIEIGDFVWICAECFVGPGVRIREGTVLYARCILVKDTEAWTVYGGGGARIIKKRRIDDENQKLLENT